MKNFLLILLFTGFALILSGQVSDSTFRSSFPTYRIGVTPSSLLNPYPGFSLSHELAVSSGTSLILETAYLFFSGSDKITNFSGYRLRPSFNFDLSPRKLGGTELYLFYNYRFFVGTTTTELRKANGAYIEYQKRDFTNTFTGWGFGMNYGFVNGNYLTKVGVGLGAGPWINKYKDPSIKEIPYLGYFTKGVDHMLILILHCNISLVNLPKLFK